MISRVRQALRQAVDLRERVRQDVRENRFAADDINMDTYNHLIGTIAGLIPDDPVLTSMIQMPDANLQTYAFIGQPPAPAAPSIRLEARLTMLINRIELILGESSGTVMPRRSAKSVLSDEKSAEIRAIINEVDRLAGTKTKLPAVEARDFKFVANTKLRDLLTRDFVEAQRCLSTQAFKAAALLSAGIIEGMLLDKLQDSGVMAQSNYAQAVSRFPNVAGSVNWDRVNLTHMVEAARALKLLSESAVRLAEGTPDFRDTIHPNAELREGIRAEQEEAKLLLALVELIYRDLAR